MAEVTKASLEAEGYTGKVWEASAIATIARNGVWDLGKISDFSHRFFTTREECEAWGASADPRVIAEEYKADILECVTQDEYGGPLFADGLHIDVNTVYYEDDYEKGFRVSENGYEPLSKVTLDWGPRG